MKRLNSPLYRGEYMEQTLSKKRWISWITITSLIVLSNYLAYTLPIMAPVPKEMALGSLLDFMLVIPIVTYFLIIRKRYSLKYIIPVVVVGYVAAKFIIPNEYLQSYPYFTYIVIVGEVAFICLELYILYKVARKLPTIINFYRQYKQQSSSFSYAIEKAVDQTLPRSRTVNVLLSECKLFYYALFSWRKKVQMDDRTFTYHQKTGAIAFYIMIIHAMVIETVGFHFLLHQWNPIISWVLLALNIYGFLFLLAEVQAIRLSPYVITNNEVVLQVGLTKKITVPFHKIESIHYYKEVEKPEQEKKDIFDATIKEFIQEPATFEITLTEPIQAHFLYGFQRKVSRIHLNVDDQQKFYNRMIGKIEQNN